MNAYLEYDPNAFRGKTILLPCDDPEWSHFTRFFAANFEAYGLKKLISTSYAPNSKPNSQAYEPSLFELESPQFDEALELTHGKKFVLTCEDVNGDGLIDIDDLKWEYLEGDGDFRSVEVTTLRDEADIVVTNPPFSLFREFIAWIVEGGNDCVILGNLNAMTYKQTFSLISENKLWLGATISSGDREFRVPSDYPLTAARSRTDEGGVKYVRVKGVRWFTTLEHGRRHEILNLMSMEDNKRYSKHKEVRGVGYLTYENYDALEVPFTDAIPNDYTKEMGVPVTFLDKYNPEQFQILGTTDRGGDGLLDYLKKPHTRFDAPVVDGKGLYKRVIIKARSI